MSCQLILIVHLTAPFLVSRPTVTSLHMYLHIQKINLQFAWEKTHGLSVWIWLILLDLILFPSFSYKCHNSILYSYIKSHYIYSTFSLWVPLQWASWLLCTVQQWARVWRFLWGMLTQSPLGVCPPCLSLEHHTEVWKTPPMLKHIIMQYCRGCVLAPLITLEKSGSNEKPSSQKEMQVFKSYNLDLRQSGSQDWDTVWPLLSTWTSRFTWFFFFYKMAAKGSSFETHFYQCFQVKMVSHEIHG